MDTAASGLEERSQAALSSVPFEVAIRLAWVGQVGQDLVVTIHQGDRMRTLSAKDAKYGFGRLIDLARAAPVTVAKYERPVVVVLSVEE